jgi:AcrR family transcriptional regulator
MSRVSEADTKTLILDAAEQAFADLGFDAASLRHIISVAGVNLAAVHYHFGSKDAMIEAVFARRIGPLNDERMRLLEAMESSGNKGPLPLEGVIEALVGPALRLSRDEARGGQVFMRLLGRTVAEPSESLQKMLNQQFGPLVQRFMDAFHRALPKLPPVELFWRVHFIVGAMAHTMCDPQNLRNVSGGLCDCDDTEGIIQRMVVFLAAGMRAPWKSEAV